MTNPIVYNPMATATIGAESLIQQQQFDALSQPISGLNAGTNYRVSEVFTMLPSGPLRNTAALLRDVPDTVISYRMVPAADGPPVPEYVFLRQGPNAVTFENAVPRIGTGGPGGSPAPTSSLMVNLGSATVLIGANVLMAKADIPSPLAGPVLGGSFALADFATGMPSAPTNQFFRTSLASMGVGTTAQYGWAYGLDAVGIRMGTTENMAGSIGGTFLTFAVPMTPKLWLPVVGAFNNSFYSQTFVNGFRSAVGVGLVGAAGSNSYVFLAQGGPAGGAGLAGGTMQAAGALGAVLMGSSLGGWITEAATGMNDETDDYGQLAKMARDRMYSDAWGALGRSPLGHLMAGLTVACGYGDEFAEGLGYAQKSIVRDVADWTDRMDPALLSVLMSSSSPQLNEPMAADALDQGVRNFYSTNSTAMGNSYRVVNLLRRTYQLHDDQGGVTRFVDVNGAVTNRQGFTNYAIALAQRELNSRNRRLEALYRQNGLTVRDGRVAPTLGSAFSDDQIAFIRGDGAQISYEIVRLANALETLRPGAVAAN